MSWLYSPLLASPVESGAITYNLLADSISTGSPTLGTPSIGQVHVLAASGITTGAPTLGTPALDRQPSENTYPQQHLSITLGLGF